MLGPLENEMMHLEGTDWKPIDVKPIFGTWQHIYVRERSHTAQV